MRIHREPDKIKLHERQDHDDEENRTQGDGSLGTQGDGSLVSPTSQRSSVAQGNRSLGTQVDGSLVSPALLRSSGCSLCLTLPDTP